jgi:acyl-CoA reductase-like NAD-dependent aldehyde dehydrogenase
VRGAMLARAAALLDADKEEIARVLSREEGKTFAESLGEVKKAVNVLEFISAEGRRLGGHTVPSELARNFCYTVRQPLGVVACITPWNFPVAIPFWKMAPALVAGNTVVFKPATLTPETAAAVVSIFDRAGAPAGVVNMVLGSGGTVGNALVDAPHVRAVSFTGSTEVGTALYARAAARLARVQCEMGGKNPVVILADADLDLAVEAVANGAYGSTGQRCTATSRVVVEESVADAFVERLVARTARVRVGNGLEQGIDMGPAVDLAQMQTDLQYVQIAQEEGAKMLCGGGRPPGQSFEHGYYVQPTVFDHVGPGMRLAQEEVFGPVVAVLRVPDFERALEVANGVRYGLSASVFTADVTRAFRFVDAIEAGIVHVNSGTPGGEAQLPFGGTKETGVGPREQGTSAIEFFSELKTVYFDYTGESRKTKVY